MKQVNIHEAKTNLSRLVEEVREGEVIILAKAGRPVAKLVPITEGRRPRKPGYLKGKIKIAADFDAPLADELLDTFEGNA
ncbi:MAG TPA: type II toxin-antitoxin system Phd/YefM family antitoxin [Labilithrix sp.]|jgi:prevent-host-death family protein|nr:type II toxin-antitoxin system Phd/YefM family antitoxin [Labilithrix sp.]